MVFGGAVGLVLFALIFIFCIIWLTIRYEFSKKFSPKKNISIVVFCYSLFLIYLKWFHKIHIKYSSLNFGDIQNLYIEHRLFSLHIQSIYLFSIFSIFLWRLPIVSIKNIHLKIRKQISNKTKEKNSWKNKLHLLKVIIKKLHLKKKRVNFLFSMYQFELISCKLNMIISNYHFNGCHYIHLIHQIIPSRMNLFIEFYIKKTHFHLVLICGLMVNMLN